MTTLSPIRHVQRSSGAGRITAAVLVIASLSVGFAAIELFSRTYTALGDQADERDRLITFFQSGGKVIENHGATFTYAPHSDIRNLTVYFSDRDFVSQYDYRFHTNNFGLV